MARIMAIDYGRKRVGIAVTDPLKIAILSGFFLVDELMKEKMKKGLPYSITAQDADEIGKITEDLIELIDRNI